MSILKTVFFFCINSDFQHSMAAPTTLNSYETITSLQGDWKLAPAD